MCPLTLSRALDVLVLNGVVDGGMLVLIDASACRDVETLIGLSDARPDVRCGLTRRASDILNHINPQNENLSCVNAGLAADR